MDALVPGVAVWDAPGSQLTPVLGEWEGRVGSAGPQVRGSDLFPFLFGVVGHVSIAHSINFGK